MAPSVPKLQAVIIGDSITRYLKENISSSLVDVAVVTFPGATICSLRKKIRDGAVKAFTENPPSIVALLIGTNSLDRGFLHSNIRDFKLLLRGVREAFPRSTLLFSGILPREDSAALDVSRVHHNIHIGNVCAATGNCRFIDFSNDFKWWHFARDGLHLNWDGNYRFAELMQVHLERLASRSVVHVHLQSTNDISFSDDSNSGSEQF